LHLDLGYVLFLFSSTSKSLFSCWGDGCSAPSCGVIPIAATPVPHVLDSSATSFDTDDAGVAVDVGAYPKTNSTS
jgi:hypothetical protein